MMCKQVPAYLPHELLGFQHDELSGTLLTFDLLEKLNTLEKEQQEQAGNDNASSRMRKFKSRK